MARLSQMVSAFMGGKQKMTDFMPSFQNPKKVENEKVENKLVSKVLALFGGTN